jgi:cytochrome c553
MKANSGHPWRVLALVVLAAASAQAQQTPSAVKPDPARGQQIVNQVCAACHAADGNSVIPANPKLAGQSADYLIKQLVDFSKPAGDQAGRENPIMATFAATLSDADKRNVAAYFASQAFKPGFARSKEHLETGQRLYRTGVPEKAVPACAGCHGPAGDGLPVMFPRIGGQQGDYIEAQLRAFRDGSRRNSLPMGQIAFRLNDAEIKALADYVSGLRQR